MPELCHFEKLLEAVGKEGFAFHHDGIHLESGFHDVHWSHTEGDERIRVIQSLQQDHQDFEPGLTDIEFWKESPAGKQGFVLRFEPILKELYLQHVIEDKKGTQTRTFIGTPGFFRKEANAHYDAVRDILIALSKQQGLFAVPDKMKIRYSGFRAKLAGLLGEFTQAEGRKVSEHGRVHAQKALWAVANYEKVARSEGKAELQRRMDLAEALQGRLPATLDELLEEVDEKRRKEDH